MERKILSQDLISFFSPLFIFPNLYIYNKEIKVRKKNHHFRSGLKMTNIAIISLSFKFYHNDLMLNVLKTIKGMVEVFDHLKIFGVQKIIAACIISAKLLF